MNTLKILLLASMAFAAFATSSNADDLADLRSQIEGLNSRIVQLESTPSVPAGYQLVTVSETNSIILPGTDNDRFFGSKGTAISIMPTADVPAAAEVVWTGYVAAAATYVRNDFERFDLNGDGDFVDVVNGVREAAHDTQFMDIMSKASLNVKGTTDTAIGEVGVSITLLADANTAIGGNNRSNDPSVATDGFKGWWKITPELELSGGVFGSAAKNSQGWKGACSCYFLGEDPTGHYGTSLGNDAAQIRLTYKSGPIAFALAVEDYDNDGNSSAIGVAGEFKWSGDGFGFELNAGFWDSVVSGSDANWSVSAGANFGLGEIASITAAVGLGEDRHTLGNADNYTKGSVMATFNMSDEISTELGAAYRNYKGRNDLWAIGGGIYYQPVDQLTIGFEGLYSENFGMFARESEAVEAAFITVYRF